MLQNLCSVLCVKIRNNPPILKYETKNLTNGIFLSKFFWGSGYHISKIFRIFLGLQNYFKFVT